jgi:hypothetical protein
MRCVCAALTFVWLGCSGSGSKDIDDEVKRVEKPGYMTMKQTVDARAASQISVSLTKQ